METIKVQVYVHGAPTVIDYNLTLNRIFRLKKFRSGHHAMQEFFNPPSSYLTIQTLCARIGVSTGPILHNYYAAQRADKIIGAFSSSLYDVEYYIS